MAKKFSEFKVKLANTAREHWRLATSTLCVSGIFDLLKEYYRAKVMDWAMEHMGRLGEWIVINPASIFSLGVALLLVIFVGIVIRELLQSRESSLIGTDKKPIYVSNSNKRALSWVVFVGIVCIGLVLLGYVRYSEPPLNAQITGSAVGDLSASPRLGPIGVVCLILSVSNSGPPTTLNAWGMEVRVADGETAVGQLTIKKSLLRLNGDNTIFDTIETSEFIQNKTATSPIPIGGRVPGLICATFPGFPRDTLNFPGNKIFLNFQDVRNRSYRGEYRVPAKNDAPKRPS